MFPEVAAVEVVVDVVIEGFLKFVVGRFLKVVVEGFLKVVVGGFLKVVIEGFLRVVVEGFHPSTPYSNRPVDIGVPDRLPGTVSPSPLWSVAMSIKERIRYGSVELKRVYNRNLGIAMAISVLVHLALIGVYLVVTRDAVSSTTGTRPTSGPTIILGPGPKILEPIDPPVEVPVRGGGGPAPHVSSLRFNQVKITDTPIDSTVDELPVAPNPNGIEVTNLGGVYGNGEGSGNGSVSGGGGGGSDSGNGGNARPATPVAPIPEPPDFNPLAVLPDVDITELSGRVKYPPIALKNGIEGSVVVKVLIGEDGLPIRSEVEYSTNGLLDKAAQEAVMETRFKPATQDGSPVRAWLMIPIDFELKK